MTKQPSITVVEHDSMLGMLFLEVLAQAGYAAELWAERAGAVEFIRQTRPGVIILDLWLRHRDEGWQVFADLQRNPSTRPIPIILCTDDTVSLQQHYGQAAGRAAAILEKPFDIEMLLAVVADLHGVEAHVPAQNRSHEEAHRHARAAGAAPLYAD